MVRVIGCLWKIRWFTAIALDLLRACALFTSNPPRFHIALH